MKEQMDGRTEGWLDRSTTPLTTKPRGGQTTFHDGEPLSLAASPEGITDLGKSCASLVLVDTVGRNPRRDLCAKSRLGLVSAEWDGNAFEMTRHHVGVLEASGTHLTVQWIL